MIAKVLIQWHAKHGRKNLPWQKNFDPYHIWVSEIMLQQTQVATVIEYYKNFLKKFPTILSLANANIDEVMQSWSGLGYYRRARNLHDTAVMIRDSFKGQFPNRYEDLIKLPGIGRSTAGAILAFSFNKKYPILDGNVKRLFSRLYGIQEWSGLTLVEKKLWGIAQELLPNESIKIYTQALMDLGATICKKNNPECPQCPLIKKCLAFNKKLTHLIPASKPKKDLPITDTNILLIANAKTILLTKRTEKKVWQGLWSLPEVENDDAQTWIQKNLNIHQSQIITKGTKTATFSHYKLRMHFTHLNVQIKNDMNQIKNTIWMPLEEIEGAALPSPIKVLIKQCYKLK